MRPPFSDFEAVKQRAKANVQSGLGRLRRWWMRKYKLPASHDLFLSQTVAELHLEQLEDLYEEREGLERELEAGGGDMSAVRAAQERLEQINRALGEQAGDDLIDLWEAELAAGRVPNLDMENVQNAGRKP